VAEIIAYASIVGGPRVSPLLRSRNHFVLLLTCIGITEKTASFFLRDRACLNGLARNSLTLVLIDSDFGSSQIGSPSVPT